MLAQVEGGRVVRIQGDRANPLTAGFACAKVNRDHELVHSPQRLATPLRRVGPKGEGRFSPISWDEALDEIVSRWKAIMAESGPLALLGYAYSAHQGQINRGLVNGLFHALGTSRLQGGTVCDTCCETAWDLTVGPVGGADPESVTQSDLIVSWGADLMATNVHFWAKVEEARKGGVQVIVIDPRRSRTAQRADWHIPIRIGTDAALALGVMHILVRDKLCDESYLATHTIGFERVKAEILPRFAPARVAEITGLAVADVERFAAMYGRAKASFIRLGEGMTRLAGGGQALRAVALLPGVTGAYGRAGGGALLLTAASCELNYNAIRKPSGPAATRMVNHLRMGEALLEMRDPPIRGLFIACNNPAVTNPEAGKTRRGLAREDLFTVVHDPFLSVTARYADIVLPAATYLETEDFYRSYGSYYMQYGHRAVAPFGESRSNAAVAQALAARLGLDDAVFAMSPDEMVQELFRGATGTVAHVDAKNHPRRRADQHRPQGRPAVPHCLRQARVLLRDHGQAGSGPHARLAARSAGGGRRRALAAAAADGARLFPEPHGLHGRPLPARARGRALLHPAPRRGTLPRSRRRPAGAPLQRARRRGPGAAHQRRGAAGRGAGARPASRRGGHLRHHQHALLRPLHRHGRGRDLPEHLPRRGRLERVKPRPHPTPQRPSVTATRP